MTLLERLSTLEELARKATPGPYFVQGKGCQGPRRFIRIASDSTRDDPGVTHGICKFAQHNAEANADYFAACSPSVILELIAEIRAVLAHQGPGLVDGKGEEVGNGI